MLSTIAMAPHSGAKLLPVLPATAKSRPSSLLPSSLATSSASTLQQLVAASSTTSSASSATVLSKSLLATAASSLTAAAAAPSSTSSSSSSSTSSSAATSVSTISIPVSAFHDPNSNVITITPYIFVKTATVAEQMQALRQDKKLPKQADGGAGAAGGALRVKRRADISSKLGLPDAKPASVSRRNARERNRVKQVNLGFETLREHVPNGKKNKKMSKVQTLRSAAQYIKDLYMILHGELPELGSPADIDETEPASPLDNSMCSVSDNDNDFVDASPEQHQQQTQQQPQPEQGLKQQQLQQHQENLSQGNEQQENMLQEQKRQLLHQPQQILQEYGGQLIQLQQQHHKQQQQEQQDQLFHHGTQLFQTQEPETPQESMDINESDKMAMSPSSARSPLPSSPIFQNGDSPVCERIQNLKQQREISHQQIQLQIQQRQQQQQQEQQEFSQLHQQRELQQKLLRQHQEQQKKRQLLQQQKEEKQQQQLKKQQEKQQSLSKSHVRQQKQRQTQLRQKQQPLILKKEPLSVLQQQLNRGNIAQLQRLQAHLHDQAQQQQQQQQQQKQSPPPSQQQQQIQLDHRQQQVSFDPSAVRTDSMTCTSANFGFSRSASTGSDVQLPDTPLSAYAAGANVSGNSPIPGSPLVFGSSRRSHGDSPLPGTPTTFTELSPVSLEDDQCENYLSLTNAEPPHPIPLQNHHQHQSAVSDFLAVDQSAGSIRRFGLSAQVQHISNGCGGGGDSTGVDVPTSPSMLQPATYINDSNMNVVTTPPPNPSDFEALHTYYKSIHTEHFIKNIDDGVFAFEPSNNSSLLSNPVINNNNNNNTETANNNILNSSNHNTSISSNNSSIAAILNNTSNIVNTLLNSNSNTISNFGSYLSAKNNNSVLNSSSKLTHSPTSSLGSHSSITSSDADLTITGNSSACYSNNNNNNNDDSCYDDDNGMTNMDTYESLDGEALQDISNWISELCSQGMHGADIGHNQPMTMAYSH